jgi:ribosomal protein L6P/L9E
LIGTHKKEIMQLVAFIRSLKVPDSYKGKGFLLEFEKVNLKEGKKV